jgi:hypothetical protein
MTQEDPRMTGIEAGCTDGSCPNVIGTDDPAVKAVRGRVPGSDAEQILFVPTAVLSEWAASRAASAG